MIKMPEADHVARLNTTEETYIETIDELLRGLGYASVTDIAKALNVKSPSVTSMLKKLDSVGFVKYTPYRNVALTEKGKELAGFLKKREKSLETFLDLLGVEETSAEQDACAIEHILHAPTLQKLSVFVKFLQTPEGAVALEKFREYQHDNQT
ncbi:MAG: metal-dependent transcriptional regulator [Candidatus Bathyarchaeia archaeon]|jgi:DtxR family Mn-dependent transcriptional regulator